MRGSRRARDSAPQCIIPICHFLSAEQRADRRLGLEPAVVHVEVRRAIEFIDGFGGHEAGRKVGKHWIEDQFGRLDEMSDQLTRILVAHGNADRGGADAGLAQFIGTHFRMAGEGGAEDDRVGLAE